MKHRLSATVLFVLILCAAQASARAQPRRGMTPADTLRVAEVSDAQISPNGVWVAYVVSTNEGDEARRGALWLVQPGARVATTRVGDDEGVRLSAAVRVPTPGLDASRPRWSPDGRLLAFFGAGERESGIWVVSVAERTSSPRLVARVRETNFHIPYAGELFAWSPDGRRIAFVSATEEERDEDARAGEGSRRDDPRVIDRARYKSRTSFSDRLRTHVFVVDLDDPAQPRQLTSGLFYDHALTWSPRGDEVAFLSNREPDADAVNNSDIFAVSTADGRTRRVTDTRGSEYEPQWSPDGRWIAHAATTRDVTTIDSVSEDAHVWVVEAAGGERREVGGALDRRARAPRWAPDSRNVFFLAGERGRTLIFQAGIDGGPPRVLFDRFTQRPREEAAENAPALPLRPYQISSYSLSTRPAALFAFTLADALRPAEVWVGAATGERAGRLSGHNDALLRSLVLAEPEDFTFKSFDGTTVQGWLMRPLGFRPAGSQRHPLVLSIHGGPHGMYGYAFDATFQAYAARGYAVLYLNPRGSAGYGQRFSDGTFREWGGGDFRDLMAGVDEVLAKHTWLDAERMGVTGGSYGGFMTNWVVTQTPRFRAAVARASVSNLVSFYGTSLYQDLIHAEFGGFPWDDYELLWRWSPLRYVRDARTPTLFIHGELDNDVHVTQAEEMYMALRRRGVETQLVRYPREGHSMREPRHRQDSIERTIAWFDRFLK